MDELDDIVAELDAKYSGKLPEGAIRAAQRRREEITPRLIELIRRATADAGSGKEVEGNGHLYALYLLTEFGVREALPAIVDAISLPGEGPFQLFGDAVTEDLSRVLAALAVDSPEVVARIVADRSLNEYVRWEAAQTYLYWVRDGRMTRDEAVKRLREHLAEATANHDSQAASGIVAELVSYAPREAVEEIKEALRRGLVDESIVNWNSVQRSVAEGTARIDEELVRCPPTGINDTVDELSRWAAFRQPEKRRAPRPHPATRSMRPLDDSQRVGGAPGTIRHTGTRPGRNDPCPCGSGKKYKQCCGRK